jgi:hypothetical protein
MKAGIIIGLVEAIALAIGFVLWHFGVIAGWIVPLFLLAPPIIVIVLGILFFSNAQANGQNPFQ